ncbi:VanZ family protein [Microbispora bryophytorum]|uniref:VanZ family protein n=1 Tax=Microbispora bryophytorum TaxID=1460882 RepID=UPI0033D68672
MREAWSTWLYVIVATVCAVPVAALAVVLLTPHRARRGHPAPLRTTVADVVMVTGTAPWIWMILTPGTEEGVHVVPLVDLAGQVARLSTGAAVAQIGGNLLVFAALGAMLPVRSARFASPAAVAAVAATASLGVEILQYGLRLGRVSSVDDVILNTAGAVLAALCTRRWWASPPPVHPQVVGPR